MASAVEMGTRKLGFKAVVDLVAWDVSNAWGCSWCVIKSCSGGWMASPMAGNPMAASDAF